MNRIDDSLERTPGSERDRRNRRWVTIWSFVWALSFTGLALVIKRNWWSSGVVLAGVIGTALFGLATVLAYRVFLRETDELRRKIEVEALALAFGVGVFGGLSYWLLVLSDLASVKDFAFVFVAMIFTHIGGVLVGCRRYS